MRLLMRGIKPRMSINMLGLTQFGPVFLILHHPILKSG